MKLRPSFTIFSYKLQILFEGDFYSRVAFIRENAAAVHLLWSDLRSQDQFNSSRVNALLSFNTSKYYAAIAGQNWVELKESGISA